MGKTTEIEWTDSTFNPWMGCTKVSPACKNCYAERDFDHRYGKVKWGPSGTRVLTTDANWNKPLKWDREAKESGQRKRVFCASLADVFEDWQGPIQNSKGQRLFWSHSRKPSESVFHWIAEPDCAGGETPVTMNDVRARLFALIDATPNLDWLLLTKRPENILSMWDDMPRGFPHKHRANCWLGTSTENQEYADKRIPHLVNCRELSPVLFLSAEPLLGPVDLTRIEGQIGIGLHSYDVLNGRNYHWDDGGRWNLHDKIDWVIVGGESGPNARPMNPAWARAIRDQCETAGVAFLHKQNGEFVDEFHRASDECDANQRDESFMKYVHAPDGKLIDYEGVAMFKVGKKKAGRLLDGKTYNGFPVVK